MPPRPTSPPKHKLVSLLREDRELAACVPSAQRASAERASIAALHSVAKGTWQPPPTGLGDGAAIGLHLVSGFISASIEVNGRAALEILGPGDLLHPWVRRDPDSVVGSKLAWCAHENARLAVLDGEFAKRMSPWPEFFAVLLHRATLRSRRLALQAAINSHPRISQRLLLTMWDHADRWGKVTRDGVRIPFRLRHHHLAFAVGSQRPTASKALSEMQSSGSITAERNGWLLAGPPPVEYMQLREQTLL